MRLRIRPPLASRFYSLISNTPPIVSSRDRTQAEPISSITMSSFQITWEKNQSWQLQFTAYDDKSTAYGLLNVENIITFNGQDYVIKQSVPNYTTGFTTIAITATHIMYDCNKIYQVNMKDSSDSAISYTPADVMGFVFDSNKEGYTYEIVGNFSSGKISSLGNLDGQSALSQIVSTWPDAVITANNKHIIITQQASWTKNISGRLAYQYNIDNVTPTYDSTDITNAVWITNQASQDEQGNTVSPSFTQILVTNDASIAKWGIHYLATISDQQFTDVTSATTYALSQLQPEPTLSISTTYLGHDMPIMGEIRRLQIPEAGISTDIELVGYTIFPYDDTQSSQVTLNSTGQSILDYQSAQQASINDIKRQIKQLTQGGK